jgi:hypothetical protein
MHRPLYCRDGCRRLPPPPPRAKKTKVAGEAKPKNLNAIDAAAQLLAGTGEPMNTCQMIAAMAAKGLWSSPGGTTHATLYSANLREITVKGRTPG